MDDAEIDRIISEIDQMAQRIGQRFVPDPDKLAAFRETQRNRCGYQAEYDRWAKELRTTKG